MIDDTIAAIATAPGRGSVGIVRVSGPKCSAIADKILGFVPEAREAIHSVFRDVQGDALDLGIALFFKGPRSFTGEDVLELQGHGGPVVMDLLLEATLQCGARLATAGEFSQRAFLNDKLDLTQAEAIADLIDAGSREAAKSALISIKGEFSRKIDALISNLTELRMYVESAIDFPEEEIDFLGDGIVNSRLTTLLQQCQYVFKQAKQGALLKEGIKVVIVGKPNAGKSSLLNALAGKDTAIVTDVPGTTRDVLREHINIEGIPLHILDTAGLRDNPDQVERLGIERTRESIREADRILLLVDLYHEGYIRIREYWKDLGGIPEDLEKVSVVYNKIDKCADNFPLLSGKNTKIHISTQHPESLTSLREHLKNLVGYQNIGDGQFIARRRHLIAVEKAEAHIKQGQTQLSQNGAGELLAEDLRLAQACLSEITGKVTPDDLLGRIFSSFCVGK